MGGKTNASEQIIAARMPQKGTTLRGRGYGLWVTGYGGWVTGDGKRGEIKREKNMKTKPNTMQKKGKTEIYDDILEKSA